MEKYAKPIFWAMPVLLIGIMLFFNVTAPSAYFSDSFGYDPYPPPGTPGAPNYPYNVYIPFVIKDFPPVSMHSYYIQTSDNINEIGQDICNNHLNHPGKQDSFVFLHFGAPRDYGTSYGTLLLSGDEAPDSLPLEC